MTKEEIKANELIERFGENAINVCNEIITDLKSLYLNLYENEVNFEATNRFSTRIKIWQSVKQILESK